MKKFLILLTSIALAAGFTNAAEKKDRKNDKDDKYPKKEAVFNNFSVVIEGAKDKTEEDIISTALHELKDVKIEGFKKGEKGVEAVLITKNRLSRGDVSKVLKDNKDLKGNKDLKITEFKAVRPDKDKDEKKDDKKDDKKEDRKAGDKKDDTKMDDKKPS